MLAVELSGAGGIRGSRADEDRGFELDSSERIFSALEIGGLRWFTGGAKARLAEEVGGPTAYFGGLPLGRREAFVAR